MQKNIAALLRKGHDSYSDGKGVISQSLIDRISATYRDTGTCWKDRSYWRAYVREKYSVPHFLEEENGEPRSSFIYVYFNDLPKAIYMSDWSIAKLEAAHESAPLLQRNVIEQKGYWPPRWFNSESGSGAVQNSALLGMMATGGAAMLELLNEMHHGSGVLAHNLGRLFTNSNRYDGLYLMIGGMAAFAAVIHGSSPLGRYLGRKADESRLKGIPEEAHSFLYGKEAIDEINREHAIMTEEKRKIDIYSEMAKAGISMTKPQFYSLYSYLTSEERQPKPDLSWLQGQKLPLDMAIGIIESKRP